MPVSFESKEIVQALLASAGLSVPSDEIDDIVADYVSTQKSIDRIWAIDIGDAWPVLQFRAEVLDEAGWEAT